MESMFFFVVLPGISLILQWVLTHSKASTGKKYIPAGAAGLIQLVCGGACFGWWPLPDTYFLGGRGGFISFPDYAMVALFCIPILFGLGLGALFGVAEFPWDEEKKGDV